MAKEDVLKCDYCKKINIPVIQVKGELSFQRSKNDEIVAIKDKDICLSCFFKQASEKGAVILWNDEEY